MANDEYEIAYGRGAVLAVLARNNRELNAPAPRALARGGNLRSPRVGRPCLNSRQITLLRS